KVLGNVTPGMTEQARRGIEIGGDARSASFICPDGDIRIRGFYFGGERARITGGKSFQASIVQEATVEVQGDIRIDKEAVDSTLRTQSALMMSAGRCVGGRSFVVCGDEALSWGNEAGKRTEISLCS